jgi:hypothetical protein
MSIKPSGYSGTPLAKKLGIKSGFRIKLVNQPNYYFELFDDLPADIKVLNDIKSKKNFIHYFAKSATQLIKDIKSIKNEIEPDGMIWISWSKKTSGIQSDVTENLVRETGLKNGLVDIKVCAVDEIWSGLKFVIPVKDR